MPNRDLNGDPDFLASSLFGIVDERWIPIQRLSPLYLRHFMIRFLQALRERGQITHYAGTGFDAAAQSHKALFLH